MGKMAKCKTCGKNITLFRRILLSECESCEEKERKKREKAEEREAKENEAKKLLKTRGIELGSDLQMERFARVSEYHGAQVARECCKIDSQDISINIEGRLNKLLPQKLKSEGQLYINRYALDPKTGKKVDIYQKLIERIIKENYNADKVEKIINQFYDDLIISLETEKIKQRQEKLKLKQQAEEQYFGKEKTKRLTLTEEEKGAILAKFNNRCAICGGEEGLHIHHKDKNPKNSAISNLIVLCGICHKKIHMSVR